MFKPVVLALMAAIALGSAAEKHSLSVKPFAPPPVFSQAKSYVGNETETVVVYFSPLAQTDVAKYLGFGIAYHMAVVYTDAAGQSYGASARPSNLKAALTAQNAFRALVSLASGEPSSFGTLIADPRNNTVFIKGTPSDFYTQDASGLSYPHLVVKRGKDLTAQWASIVRSYEGLSQLGLTYSPTSQNSNSMAATALLRAGIGLDFSSSTYFVPGAYTVLPLAPTPPVMKHTTPTAKIATS